MSIEAHVTAFVVQKDIVMLPKTLKMANAEASGYVWYRISDGNHLCTHGDKSYVISIDGDKIGCSCPAMSFHCKGDDVCKHIVAFTSLPARQTAPLPSNLAMELISAGWSGEPGTLLPKARLLEAGGEPVTIDGVQLFDEEGQEVYADATNATSDEDGEDSGGADPMPPDADKKPVPPEPKLGENVFEKVCPHCGKVERMADAADASKWLKDHVASCKKNPVNVEDEVNNMKDTKKENVEMNEQMKRVVTEAEGLGAKDIDPAYVADQLEALTGRFKVNDSEAERSVVSSILWQQGLQRLRGKDAPNTLLAVGLIDSAGRWVNTRVKVVDIWDSEVASIRQVGLIGDETGTTKFVSWETSNLPLLTKDKCYSIENVVTDEYDGRFSVKFTKNTKIAEISEDIEVGYTTVEFTGILVDIQKGSGLIRRCPTCNRAMSAGSCAEHGACKGTDDLRIKGVLDDGITTTRILLNRERTEQLTGIDLDAAIAIAQEEFDASMVSVKMEADLISKEFVVTGSDMGDTILVESIREIKGAASEHDIGALLAEV